MPSRTTSALRLAACAVLGLLAACGTSDRGIAIDRIIRDAEPDALPDAPDDTVADAGDVADDAGDDALDATELLDTDAADGSAEPPPVFPTVFTSLDTRLLPSRVAAGTTVYVDCQARNSEGELTALPEGTVPRFVIAPSDAFQPRSPVATGNDIVPILAGEATVGCSLPALGLIDPTPAPLLVTPGRPAVVVTTLPRYVIDAGQSVVASCEAFDAWGNEVTEFAATVRTDPFGDGVETAGLRATFERAGVYEVTCDVDGAAEVVPATLEVKAGLPASIALGLAPDLPRYSLNSVVRLLPTVQDRFGNFVTDPQLQFTNDGGLDDFGAGRFRLDQEGTFTLTAFIDPPTATGARIEASRDVVVSGSGPAIECLSPAQGEMVDYAPGTPLVFRGDVSDEFGVASVTVNGVPATVAPGGGFDAVIPTRFGINFAEIVAQDSLGETSRRTCAFLVSDEWVPEATFLSREIALRLTQAALDDGIRGDGFNSINDFLVTVLNSAGLRNTIHEALLAANPLYPERCVVDSFLGCLTRVGVTYQDMRLNGPHDVSLQFVDGGLRTVATVRGIGVRLRISGTFGTQGWVNVDSIGVDLTFNVNLASGRPSVTLRAINNVSVGGVNTDFSGLVGLVIDIVVDIFEDTIRGILRDTIRDFIRDSFNDVLDDIFSGLEIDTIGASFDVPRLDGGAPLALGFGISIDGVEFSPARALFTIGARITGDVLRGGPTPGAAIPPGPVFIDPDTGRRVSASVSLALLNQALHALWRGAFFEASISGVSLGDTFPGEATASLRVDLPPVAFGTPDGGVGVGLGAVTANVVYPGLFDEPIAVEIGAVARTGAGVRGDTDLYFDDVRLEEFFLDTGAVRLDATSAQLLDDFLRAVIQTVIDDSVNGALPSLPIPSFALPTSLSVYDLPGGRDLRVLDPVLTISPSHMLVGGNFGVR
jgi:hypothetical protein